MGKVISKRLRDNLVKTACEQYDTSVRFKQARMAEIQSSIDLYDNKTLPAGRGRFNVPVPVMAGYVDTLMSKIDEGVALNFKYTNPANLIKSKKLQAAWEKESGPSRGNWNRVDRAVKKNAIFAGVFLYEHYAESDPDFKSILNGIDYLDFHCEPLGGQNLENHLFAGVDNVFKTKSELEDGAKSGLYDADEVVRLIENSGRDDYKRNTDKLHQKQQRFINLGLDPENHSFVGSKVLSLIKWVIEMDGVRYYLLFDYHAKVAVRCVRLKEINKSNRMPWVAAHTHSDLLNFWSKAPADDIRPIAEAINVLFNQALDNRQKKNFGMRAVDTSMFTDMSLLEWRPDGLIPANTNGGQRPLSDGIYELQTDEVTGTIDLISFMDDFIGRKSGITGDSQGESDEQRVGIYYGNLQQVADRLGLYNKSYAEAHAQLGLLFQEGVRMHMTEEYLVRWVGEDGAISEGNVEKDDAIPDGEDGDDFPVDVVGGQAEMRSNEIKKASRKEALASILSNANLAQRVNPTWAIKEILKTGDYDKDEISMALDVNSDGSMEQIARASKVIQEFLNGETPREQRTADTMFVQRIMDYAVDEVEDMVMFDAMMAYAEQHMTIALDNMMRKARKATAQAGLGAPVATGAKPEAKPIPNTEGGTASMSADLGDMTPGSPMTLGVGQ